MRTRIALAATIATAAAAGALLAPAGAGAAPQFPACSPGCDFVVNSTADLPDARPGDGVCATASRKCTLRAAVQEGNATIDKPPFQSKILVPPGTYVLTRHGLDDNAARGDLDLHFFGQVIGAGQSRTVVDGDGADRVFDLHARDERVAHLTVRNGRATDGPGGGIRAEGDFNFLDYLYVIDNVAVPGEAPDSGSGGGIAGGEAEILHSYMLYNDAQDGGGVWRREGGNGRLALDAIAYNSATRDGGGLYFAAGDAGFTAITVSGNDAGEHGGGVFLAPSARPIRLEGSTIASNRAPEGGGGGIWRAATEEGTVHGNVGGLIVARNGDAACAGPGVLNPENGNVDDDGTCGFEVSGVDPLLGPLAYNGGPTPTRALQPDSPAIDAWSCMFMTDQRGAKRPQGDGCDAGAYEIASCCPASEPPYKPGRPPPPGPRSYCGLLKYGTAGADVIKGDDGRDDIHGLAGNDRLFGDGNADCLYGGSGDDFMKGGDGHDALYGKSGDDVLSGGGNEDLLLGYGGRDRLYGGADEDRLYGGPGGDYIKGGGGYDIISAGPGNDVIDAAGGGLDTVDCGSGFDRVKAKRLEHLYRCERVKYVG